MESDSHRSLPATMAAQTLEESANPSFSVPDDNDSDYSSDSSLASNLPSTRPYAADQQGDAGRQQPGAEGQRRRRGAAHGDGSSGLSGVAAGASEMVVGYPYRFAAAHTHERKRVEGKKDFSDADTDKIDLGHLTELVNFDRNDLLRRAWNHRSIHQKTAAYAPFLTLPQCPNILEVRLSDTTEVSKFMCQMSIDLIGRQRCVANSQWYSFVVFHSVESEIYRLGHDNGAQQPLPDEALNPEWDTELAESDDLDCDAVADGSESVESIDFSVALGIAQSFDHRVSARSLGLLHQLVNKCIRTGNLTVLRSWGVQRITTALLQQIDASAKATQCVTHATSSSSTAEDAWLSTAIALAFKTTVMASNTDQLLSLLRLIYQHQRRAAATKLTGISALFDVLELPAFGRVRLHLPAFGSKCRGLALGQSVEELLSGVVGLCVVQFESDLQVIVLAEKGLFRVRVRAPAGIEAANRSFTLAGPCHGLHLEDGERLFCVVGEDAGREVAVTFDVKTLEESGRVTAPAAASTVVAALSSGTSSMAEKDRELLIYAGHGRFISPHYVCSRASSEDVFTAGARLSGKISARATGTRDALSTDKLAWFSSTAMAAVQGVIEPSSVSLHRTWESLSVQFYMSAETTTVATSMTIVSAKTADGKCWLCVRATISPSTSTLRLSFEHGAGAVVEVEEHLVESRSRHGFDGVYLPVSEWTLWSATLTAVNDIASWTIFRNGVKCGTRSQSGPLARPGSGPVQLSILTGSFAGYLAMIQLWTKAQNAADMRTAASEDGGGCGKSQFLLFSFRMNEGVGCCLHSPMTGHTWRGSFMSWAPPPCPLPIKTRGGAHAVVLPWRPPSPNYYVLTNRFEHVILDDSGVATWVNGDGKIIQQETAKLVPSLCPFYCDRDGKIYTLSPDSQGLQATQTPGTPASNVRRLPSMESSPAFYASVAASSPMGESASVSAGETSVSPLTALNIAEYVTRKLNERLLTEITTNVAGAGGGHSSSFAPVGDTVETVALSMGDTRRVSARKIGRLLSISQDLIALTGRVTDAAGKTATAPRDADDAGRVLTDFEALLLCVCGRILLRQARLIERQCPSKVVPAIVEIYNGLHTFTSAPAAEVLERTGVPSVTLQLLGEARDTFLKLHRVALAECVSHDYQLQLITECSDLTAVRQLLVPNNLPALVTAVIAKGLKKPLMTFLNRLREACQMEAKSIFEGVPPTFKASGAMLTVLMGLLCQKETVHWHLVAVALLGSLCTLIARTFQQSFPQLQEQRKQLGLLKQTAIGKAVFPAVHHLHEMQFDQSIAPSVLKVLSEIRSTLTRYAGHSESTVSENDAAQSCEDFEEEVTFTEMHTVTTPGQLSSPYTATLQLQYASSIHVEVNCNAASPVQTEENDPYKVHISLIDGDFVRHSLSLADGEANFEHGGQLLIECHRAAVVEDASAGAEEELTVPTFTVTVFVVVSIAFPRTDWIRDICSTVSYTIISSTERHLVGLVSAATSLSPAPFLRGGLTQECLRACVANGVSNGSSAAASAAPLRDREDDDDEENAEVHRQLCVIARMNSSADQPCDGDSIQAKLYKVWLDVFKSKRLPYAERLERVLRWLACAVAWHQLTPASATAGAAVLDSSAATAVVEKELSKAVDWLRRKNFLILEAMQQGRSEDIIERARFLLEDVIPRCAAESRLAAQQHTEEPVEDFLPGDRDERSHGGARRSHDTQNRSTALSHRRAGAGGPSVARPAGTETMSMTTTSTRFGTSRLPTRGGLSATAAAVRLFSSGLKQEEDSLPGKMLEFLINGNSDGTPREIAIHLAARVNQATAHINAYKLLDELCQAYSNDSEMVSRTLLSLVRYRNHVASLVQSAVSHDKKECTPDSAKSEDSQKHSRDKSAAAEQQSTWHGYNSHYAENMLGCGLRREFELQKAACSFVDNALAVLLAKLENVDGRGRLRVGGFPVKESLAMCAVLCHPWDSVDMSLLRPQKVFAFLHRLLFSELSSRLETTMTGSVAANYEESKGLFELLHRALIVPNSLLQVSVEGVRVVDGEVQGLHVENTTVVCSARNHWRALSGSSRLPLKQDTECDTFANYGLPCVVTELPDVLYFEITLDFAVHKNATLSLGLSSTSLSPIEDINEATVVYFSSDGMSRVPECEPVRFSEQWEVDDVVGCGVFAPNNSIFFTRNGKFLGCAVNSSFTTLIPFVEVRGVGSLLKVIVNFGEETPFKFNISSLHCSCRHDYLSSSTVCDAAYITVHYLITMCYKNFTAAETETTPTNRDAVSGLLERAASFLNTSILGLVKLYRQQHIACAGGTAEKDSDAVSENCLNAKKIEEERGKVVAEPLAVMCARLFHCVSLVIECFRFDAVTSKTHAKILQVCAVTLTGSHDKWIKVRAAECLGLVRRIMREDYLAEATEAFRRMVPADEVVQQLVELARWKLVKESESPPPPPPKWMGNSKVVRGKGVFFGSSPLPKKGTHMVGFRIRRRHQTGQGTGAPLGGCYYLGLCHSQPQITTMNSLIARTDVYVLQDTDDQDQVSHLLLKRQSIPRNAHRRIFGNDEVVWVQFNADKGEITFFRENMFLIGLAFANIQKRDDLYPIVYHFNEDASCEILPPPSSNNTSAEELTERLRRSVAIHSLQQLHMVPYFASAISQFIQRAISQLDRGLDSCLVALAVLGGERSYLFCQHDTFGLVVVHAIADISGKAVVYLANDEEHHLFTVPPQTLRPSFIQTPLYASGTAEAEACASLLMNELSRSLYDASVVAPLVRLEEDGRRRIEDEYAMTVEQVSTADLVGILSLATEDENRMGVASERQSTLSEQASRGEVGPVSLMASSVMPSGSFTSARQSPARADTLTVVASVSSQATPTRLLQQQTQRPSAPKLGTPSQTPQNVSLSTGVGMKQSSSASIAQAQPVVIDRQHSTKSVYTPCPSVGMTTNSCGCSTIRAHAVFERTWTVAVAITQQPTSGACTPPLSPMITGHSASNSAVALSTSLDNLLYVGVTSSVSTLAGHVEDVKDWEDAWALCNVDSYKTNNVNCSVEPSMIFSADDVLFTSGDLLLIDVDRQGGTVMFSRVRRGRRVNFGVLFEGMSESAILRPFVVCGPDTVVVFSFLGGGMFPARNTYPLSNFTRQGRESAQCSVCEAAFSPPWYVGEEGVTLCDFCFKTWQYPKDIFCLGRKPPTVPDTPLYLVSGRVPQTLTVGGYVEFEETTVPSWSEQKSVNVVQGAAAAAISVFEEAFAVTEPLSVHGSVRVDVQVGHIAGVSGNPFSGLLPFVPLWRDEQQTRTTCVVQSESLVISSSVIPPNTKTLFSIRVSETKVSQNVPLTGVFVGLTNLSDTTYTVSRVDLDRLCANNNVWGTWCDSKAKSSADGVIYILADTIHGTVMMSASLAGLYLRPFVITCSSPSSSRRVGEDNIRLVLFSHETCRVTSTEGLTSCNELVEPSFAPIVVGLVPDDSFATPCRNVFNDSVVLMDTVERSRRLTEAAWLGPDWQYTDHVLISCAGVLFNINDVLTLTLERVQSDDGEQHDGALVSVYSQGVLIAEQQLTAKAARRRYRFALHLPARGLTATFSPPVYGRTHLGRIVAVHGTEVCVVESPSDAWAMKLHTVRRRDVRYCALAASCFPDAADVLKDGAKVAFRMAPAQPPKRGTVIAFSGGVVTVAEDDNERAVIHLPLDQCFILRNESEEISRQMLYPLTSAPTSTIAKVFEVGKNKYRLQSKGSYNGIVFDCKTTETIELVGISVLSHTTGRNRADVFFKKGSNRNHERDEPSWTAIFSGFVDMQSERQFSVSFSSICIDAGSTFALYVNTSHNCGVGFYCEEDGCKGEVGSELDGDGTLTVFLGRKSGSSTPFTDFSLNPRGFAGTILYKQNKGSKPPLIEGDAVDESSHLGNSSSASGVPGVTGAPPTDNEDDLTIVSRPVVTRLGSCVWFTVRVPKAPVRVDSIRLPVILESFGDDESDEAADISAEGLQDGGVYPMSSCFGLLHCVVSLLYCSVDGDSNVSANAESLSAARELADDEALPIPQEAKDWSWAWNSRVLIDSTATEVEVCGLDMHLEPGTYYFAAVVRDLLGEHSDDCSLRLAQAADPLYTRSNALVTVSGLYGDMKVEADAPAVTGELHVLTTGSFLNQSNSASYNGIMFDMRSKQDLTLEELFCVSQTSAEHVMVRVFWKEGSMEGAEKSPVQWREVASKEMQLVDRQLFSVGSLFLRMKANQTYSLFINTSSSCGVRFYNSSDGHVGDIGEEFETDGTLTIFVGRKSESSSPFAEIPMEPRAFRGKLVYRTYITRVRENINHAMFNYFRAFVVTRMLVALSSYVDSSSERDGISGGVSVGASPAANGGGGRVSFDTRFSYENLLTVVSALATSPCESLDDLDVAENVLSTFLKSVAVEELRGGVATVPLAAHQLSETNAINVGDLVIYVPVSTDGEDLTTLVEEGRAAADGGTPNSERAVGPEQSAITVSPAAAPAKSSLLPTDQHYPHANTLFAHLARVRAVDTKDDTVVIELVTEATERTVALSRLLPLSKCWECQRSYATAKVCSATGLPHKPPSDEEYRISTMIADTLLGRKDAPTPEKALVIAKELLHDATLDAESARTRRLVSLNDDAYSAPRDVTQALRGCKLPSTSQVLVEPENANDHQSPNNAVHMGSCMLFAVPAGMLLPEEERADDSTFTCPFVFCEEMNSYVSLKVSPTTSAIDVSFVTDRPFHANKEHRGQAWCGSGPSGQQPRGTFVEAELAYALQLYAVRPSPDSASRDPLAPSVLETQELLESATALLPSPFLYIACENGLAVERILSTALAPSVCSYLAQGGALYLVLSVARTALPSPTPTVSTSADFWCWEDGSVDAQMSPVSPIFLKGSFSRASWPKDKPRFCSLTVIPRGKDKTVFLEVHVVFEYHRAPGLWDSMPRITSKTLARKPFNLASGEVVTLGFSTDGDLFICDVEDVIRCRISAAELAPPPHSSKETVRQRVGFVSVDQEKLSAKLGPLEPGHQTLSTLYSPEISSGAAKGDGYEPHWRVYDQSRVAVSRNGLAASCCSNVGGQAVLGAVMPATGVSAFVMQIDRHDRPTGASLGSGHFGGVAVATFDQLAPHFGELKNMTDSVWAVQDFQDGDSFASQAPIPPIEQEQKGSELFCCGTRLLFIVDRTAGTLSLARDHESPRIIFHGIPRDVLLCPFARLDHTSSYATLSRFSHSSLAKSSTLYQTSLEGATMRQPITASFLRRFPSSIVLKLFPALQHMVNSLPSPEAAKLEKYWSDVTVHSRFQYRMAKALNSMVELGAFGQTMINCSTDRVDELFSEPAMQKVIRSLTCIPTFEIVTIPLETVSAEVPSQPNAQTLAPRVGQAAAVASDCMLGDSHGYSVTNASLAAGATDASVATTTARKGASHEQNVNKEAAAASTTAPSMWSAGRTEAASGATETCSKHFCDDAEGERNALCNGSEGSSLAFFRIPGDYEVIGRVPGTKMVRLMLLDSESGPMERTLHLVQLDSPDCCLHTVNEVLPHPSAMRQCDVLAPLNGVPACGVITEGWFDGTLDALWETDTLPLQEDRKLVATLLCGLEHWHLHGIPHGHLSPRNIYVRVVHGTMAGCAIWNTHYLHRSSPYASPDLRTRGVRSMAGDLWSCAAVLRGFKSCYYGENSSLLKCAALLETEGMTISNILQESEVFKGAPAEEGEGPTCVLRTGARLRGGSGSYNGIMFDVIAKNTTIRITKVGFVPDTSAVATVTLYARPGSFLGVENVPTEWHKIIEKEMSLSDNVETVLEGFSPLTVAAGSRTGLFLHTTNGSGVLFFSENEGVLAGLGQVEEENNDIGITIGKKSESSQPFMAIQNQKRLLKGSITYTLITRSSGPRSSLIYTHDARSVGIGLSTEVSFTRSSLGCTPEGESLEPMYLPSEGRLCVRLLNFEEKGLSLISKDVGAFEWLATTRLLPVTYPEKPDSGNLDSGRSRNREEDALVPVRVRDGECVCVTADEVKRLQGIENSFLTAARNNFYSVTLRQRLLRCQQGCLRQLQFTMANNADVRFQNILSALRGSIAAVPMAGLDRGRSSVVVKASDDKQTAKAVPGISRQIGVWVSEPVHSRCTVSLWASTQGHVATHLYFPRAEKLPDRPSSSALGVSEGATESTSHGGALSPAASGPSAITKTEVASTDSNLIDVRDTAFLMFDTERRCVVTSSGQLVPWPHAPRTEQLAEAGTANCAPLSLVEFRIIAVQSRDAFNAGDLHSGRRRSSDGTTGVADSRAKQHDGDTAESEDNESCPEERQVLGVHKTNEAVPLFAYVSDEGDDPRSLVYAGSDTKKTHAGAPNVPQSWRQTQLTDNCCALLCDNWTADGSLPTAVTFGTGCGTAALISRQKVSRLGASGVNHQGSESAPSADAATETVSGALHFSFSNLYDNGVRARLTALPKYSRAGASGVPSDVVVPTVVANTQNQPSVEVPASSDLVLLELSRTRSWKSMVDGLLFASQSPSIEITSRTVCQVLYSSASRCQTLSPSFAQGEIHEIVLRVSCPRDKLLRLALEPAAVPNEGAVLPFFVFDTLGDEFFCSPKQLDVVLSVHVDLSAKHAYVRSSTGTFTDALYGKPASVTSATEMRLSITMMAPGSSVEFLSWRRCSVSTDLVVNPSRLAAVGKVVGVTNFSSNVAHTVGTITRHSPRGNARAEGRTNGNGRNYGTVGAESGSSSPLLGQQNPAVPFSEAEILGAGKQDKQRLSTTVATKNAVKQMEMLVVSYARVLLEKSLVAQDAARKAVKRQLHTLMSYTSLRSSAAVESVLERELRQGSYTLVAQSCAQLLAPSILQRSAGVETSVNILSFAMTNDAVLRLLSTSFGPTLALVFLRTAVVYTRSIRHAALRCAQELLSNDHVPLPRHELLCAHLAPLLGMMSGLCKRGKTSSAVVQVGVTLIADLTSRYQRVRPDLVAPGARSSVPFPVVICARAVLDAIMQDPPRALPAVLTRERMSTHRIVPELLTRTASSSVPGTQCYARFTETNRNLATVKSFEVVLSGQRKGAVILGWGLEYLKAPAAAQQGRRNEGVNTERSTPSDAALSLTTTPAAADLPQSVTVSGESDDSPPLPCCGYYIEPTLGKVFVCLGRKREETPLKVKAKAGDTIVVTCSYKDQVVQVALRRNGNKELTTSFKPTVDEHLAMPFYYAQHSTDAEPNFKGLTAGPTNINVSQLYAELRETPDELDAVAPQSYEFYAELNLFAQVVLGREKALRAASEKVQTHEIAGYAVLTSFLGAGAFTDEVPLAPLVPYLARLQLFDALTAAFSPLINLQRRSELFDIFRVLKNLCSKDTEERIQGNVMRPFQNRPGRKAHVTVHTMQAQPSASLGPYQTLVRSIFGQLYLQLRRSGAETYYVSPIFTVKLAGFGSTDAGGPYRDVLSQLATEIMSTHPSGQFQLNPLFMQCGRGGASAVMPNPALMSSSQTPMMLEFFGQLLASFFITTDVLAVEFPPLFWKLLLGEEATLKDLTVLDPDIARELMPNELMERTEEELEERFPGIGDVWRTIATDNPQLRLDSSLPPGTVEAAQLLSGRIVDTEINRFTEAIDCIQRGFHLVIPLYTLQAFRWQKVELLICGTQKLSFQAFKNECDIQLPAAEASAFLNVLETMSDEDRTLLLRFTTGQSRLPLKSRIKVQHNGSKNSLPTSSTCFFTLRLPSYSSDEMMKERLLYAVRQCKAIDADGQARENLMLDS